MQKHLKPFLLISFYADEHLAASVTLYVARWQREADLVGHQNIYNNLRLHFNNLPRAKAAASHACFDSSPHGHPDDRERREQNRTLSERDTVLRYSCLITAALKCFYTYT